MKGRMVNKQTGEEFSPTAYQKIVETTDFGKVAYWGMPDSKGNLSPPEELEDIKE